MAFKLGVFLFVIAHVCSTLALPPCVCTRNLLPVCGSDGVTYANQCLLECENTKNKDANIRVASEGSCPEANTSSEKEEICVCPYLYGPVCGTDGMSYANQCSLECEQKKRSELKVKHTGTCEQNNDLGDCVCPKLKRPVCGSDGNTYSNACLLKCAVKNNAKLSERHAGPCDDKVIVVDPVKVVE